MLHMKYVFYQISTKYCHTVMANAEQFDMQEPVIEYV